MRRTYKQGKTSVKSMVQQVLKELKNNEKSMRNYSGMHPLQ
jgi:UDP-N-acetylmuramyl pentapeptide synthase